MFLKRNDVVAVISGVHKGSRGKVIKVLEDSDQVLIQGINLRYKHLRRSQKNPRGGRVQKEGPIHISNVQLVDPKTDEPTRVGFRFEDGKKIRFSKKSGEAI